MPLGWRAYPSPATRQLQKQAAASAAAYHRFSLRPGQLVIVDEASMAVTMDLDYITTTAAGVKSPDSESHTSRGSGTLLKRPRFLLSRSTSGHLFHASEWMR